MGAEMILPFVADRETEGFRRRGRAAAGLQSLRGLRPRPAPADGALSPLRRLEHRLARGERTGRLHTWTLVTHQVHPAFPTPYTLVVVQLDDAPDVRLMGRLDGAPELAEGQPMQVWFQTLEPGVVLPQWRVA